MILVGVVWGLGKGFAIVRPIYTSVQSVTDPHRWLLGSASEKWPTSCQYRISFRLDIRLTSDGSL